MGNNIPNVPKHYANLCSLHGYLGMVINVFVYLEKKPNVPIATYALRNLPCHAMVRSSSLLMIVYLNHRLHSSADSCLGAGLQYKLHLHLAG